MQSLAHPVQASVAGVTGRGRECLRPFRAQPVAAAPFAVRRSAARRSLVISNGVGDVAKYLSEAASSIFKTDDSNVPWSGSGTPFSGRITHHEEVSRLRKVYELVKEARQQVEGCTNPSAANYNPSATSDDGTCTFVVPESDKELSGDLYTYVTSSLSSLWGSNFEQQSDKDKRADFSKLGLTGYSGDKVISQRDIQRLLSYEKVVKKALDQAEQDVESK
ncbi:g2528 [Coccomyxa viridis]|uniref:G2528 protein n=1 Tax=Coccomyxa viridis TaxID=1274662 RepID=A0ABP1FMV3_9CHLO